VLLYIGSEGAATIGVATLVAYGGYVIVTVVPPVACLLVVVVVVVITGCIPYICRAANILARSFCVSDLGTLLVQAQGVERTGSEGKGERGGGRRQRTIECRLGRGTASGGQARGALSTRAGCFLPGLTERRQLCRDGKSRQRDRGVLRCPPVQVLRVKWAQRTDAARSASACAGVPTYEHVRVLAWEPLQGRARFPAG